MIWLSYEHRVVIEKMDFLLIAHANVRVSAQKIVERRRTGFLCAGYDEIEPLNFAPLAPKHSREFTSVDL